ncbi:MAG: hypothetical protein Q8Q31_01425 [Nanoarchaeota archaeon]|nr:hypothetical protein [Nanoarchaeota archaeon]
MAEVYSTIFSTPLAQMALVFVLIFTIVFAILQKSKILGDGKKQIDALVALSIALLVISVAYALKLISGLAPFLAVSLVIILAFMLLTGLVSKGPLELKPGWVTFFTILAFVAVIIAVLFITDAFNFLKSFFGKNSSWLPNVVLIAVVGIAIWVAFIDSKS